MNISSVHNSWSLNDGTERGAGVCAVHVKQEQALWKLQANIHKTEAILFTQRRPIPPAPLHFQHNVIPWNRQVRYLGRLLDPKLLLTRHLTSVIHKATGVFLQLFPLLSRDSTLSIPNKLTLYKLCIRSILTYAAPVWSNTSSYNYRRLQISFASYS